MIIPIDLRSNHKSFMRKCELKYPVIQQSQCDREKRVRFMCIYTQHLKLTDDLNFPTNAPQDLIIHVVKPPLKVHLII